MREHGLAGIRLRRRVRTTVPDQAGHWFPDLLGRDFTADVPNRRYIGDITYLPIADGTNLYLATVIDLCSRKLVGSRVADHMRTGLIVDAINAAARNVVRCPVRYFTLTTDRSTHRMRTRSFAPNSGCVSRWARSAPAPTTLSLSRSTRHSNASYSTGHCQVVEIA